MFFYTEKSPKEIQDKEISGDNEVTFLLSTISPVTNKKKKCEKLMKWWIWIFWNPRYEVENFELNENNL